MKKEFLFKKLILPILLIALGAIYSLILPPYTQFDLAWFGMVPLLVVLRFCRPKAGFSYGLCFGIGFWSLGIWWFISLGNKGCPFALVIISYLLLVLVCALFTAIFSMLVARLWQGVKYISYQSYMDEVDRIEDLEDSEYEKEWPLFEQKMKAMGRRLAFAETWRIPVIAIMWVGLEYFRGLVGFPWNTLAVSQYKSYPIAQMAAIGGTAAISFLIVAVNAAIAGVGVRIWRLLYARDYPRIRRHFDLWFVLIIVLAAMVSGVRQYRYLDKEIRRLDSASDLLIVGAINNHDTPYLQEEIGYIKIFRNLLDTTSDLSTNGVDLIVWPETSVPEFLTNKKMNARLQKLADNCNVYLIAGGMEKVYPDKIGFDLGYNSSYMYTPNGTTASIYRKRHLVPFGEYLPLDEKIPYIRNFAPFGYSVRSGKGAQLFNINGVETGMLICFEDTFSWTARESVNSGARLLISHSNDMWFDSDVEKLQHHANAVFRAIETRTPLVRVSNDGYMGIVLPTGKTEPLLNPDETIMISEVIPRLRSMPPTLYMIVGDWILAIPSFIFVVLFVCFMYYEFEKQKNKSVLLRNKL